MYTKKHSVVAGLLLFCIVGAVVFVAFNIIRLYSAMPSRAEVVNFAEEIRGSAVDTGEKMVGSLVPDGGSTTTNEAVPVAQSDNTSTQVSADWLSGEQRRMLAQLGIDESKLPTTLTPELEACFNKAIGENRVAAIKAGDTPTLVEGMKAVTCL